MHLTPIKNLVYRIIVLQLILKFEESILFFPDNIPSLASKREHVPPKHDLIGYKHGMFGRQTFEV